MTGLETVCADCGQLFDIDPIALRRGHASWTRCQDCRQAKADENRRKLELAKASRSPDGRSPPDSDAAYVK